MLFSNRVISLFLVGAVACTNAEMVFGARTEDGAVAYLVGNENEGLNNMFIMMNEARIFVGATAVGSGIAGYQYSLQVDLLFESVFYVVANSSFYCYLVCS